MELKSMKLSPEQAREHAIGSVTAAEPEVPRYPYGLCLYLDNESISALGLLSEPEVGQTVMVTARAVVKSIDERQMMKGPNELRIELQITDMALSPESEAKLPEQTLYSGS